MADLEASESLLANGLQGSDDEELSDAEWEEETMMAAMGMEIEDVQERRQSCFEDKPDLIRMDSKDLSIEVAINKDLITAARDGDKTILRVLLSKTGADVDETDIFSGETALAAAASVGHTDVVEMLITQFGADVSERCDNTGWTPLHAAAYHLRSKCLALLIEKGAEVNSGDSSKRTPLQLTMERQAKFGRKKGFRRCVKYLEEAGGTLVASSCPEPITQAGEENFDSNTEFNTAFHSETALSDAAPAAAAEGKASAKMEPLEVKKGGSGNASTFQPRGQDDDKEEPNCCAGCVCM